ncbi:MAG: M56 family metallopeptidase [Pseudomonadota bacterium]
MTGFVLWISFLSFAVALAIASGASAYSWCSRFLTPTSPHRAHQSMLLLFLLVTLAAGFWISLIQSSWSLGLEFGIGPSAAASSEDNNQAVPAVTIVRADVVLFSLLLGVSTLRLLLLLRSFHVANSSLNNVLSESHPLTAEPTVRVTDRIVEPITAGFLSPTVLLPEHTLSKLTDAQIEAIVAHERAHIERGDPLKNLLLQITKCLFWYNLPLLSLIGRYERSREFDCDRMATASGVEPITLATAMAEIAVDVEQRKTVLMLGGSPAQLSQRIRVLMAASETERLRQMLPWLLCALTICAFLFMYGFILMKGLNLGVEHEIYFRTGG